MVLVDARRPRTAVRLVAGELIGGRPGFSARGLQAVRGSIFVHGMRVSQRSLLGVEIAVTPSRRLSPSLEERWTRFMETSVPKTEAAQPAGARGRCPFAGFFPLEAQPAGPPSGPCDRPLAWPWRGPPRHVAGVRSPAQEDLWTLYRWGRGRIPTVRPHRQGVPGSARSGTLAVPLPFDCRAELPHQLEWENTRVTVFSACPVSGLCDRCCR